MFKVWWSYLHTEKSLFHLLCFETGLVRVSLPGSPSEVPHVVCLHVSSWHILAYTHTHIHLHAPPQQECNALVKFITSHQLTRGESNHTGRLRTQTTILQTSWPPTSLTGIHTDLPNRKARSYPAAITVH